MKKIVTVVGARPQFIKAAPVSRVIRDFYDEVLVHTGQHYDQNMSEVFFRQLNIPHPDINLNVGSASHGEQTAGIILKLEKVLQDEKPSLVVVYGDTNSTLAASVIAAKMLIPVAHIEAGLRNFDMSIQEEINRVVTDKLSTYLFAPTKTAVKNLTSEGIVSNVFHTGDVMYDALLYGLQCAQSCSDILIRLNLVSRGYCLATIHRAENTDNYDNLRNIIAALGQFDERVVFPIHPRTKKVIDSNNLDIPDNILLMPAVGYFEFILLESNARMIVTDSGGVQREAYCLKVPCITIFPTTSWVETVEDGWNKLAQASTASILDTYNSTYDLSRHNSHFGNGNAALEIVNIIKEYI
ncbi:MAG: UDP-N-acetylglucosamine 2-epimerase (non-hydrolyzing) [Candidatus Cloacimonadaceae bacterium]|nr:UDP-N-acetylglucosamine 2-epimerase (non-hydrolyzing) [Candidatus Cloacimonadaceae bacterium]